MQKESLLLGKRKLSQDLEQITEDVQVEDACENDLKDDGKTIRLQRLQSYNAIKNQTSEPSSPE